MRPELPDAPGTRRVLAGLAGLAALKAIGLILIAEAVAGGIAALAAGGGLDVPRTLWLGLVGAVLRAGAVWAGQALAGRAGLGAKERLRADLLAVGLRGGTAAGRGPAAGVSAARTPAGSGSGRAPGPADSTQLPSTQLPSGELAGLATRGLDGLDGYYAKFLPALAAAPVVPLVVGIRILFADWVSALVIVLTIPLIPVFMILIGLHTQDRIATAADGLARLSAHLLELAQGLPALIGLRRASGRGGALGKVSDDYRRATLGTLRTAFLSGLALELIATLSVALVAVFIGVRLVHGDMALEAGLLALILAPECYLPLREVGNAFHASEDGAEALRRARVLVDASGPGTGRETGTPSGAGPAIVPGRSGDAAAPGGGAATHGGPVDAVVLSGLEIRYDGGATVAAPDLRLRAGDVRVLDSASGSGKSTILKAVLGLLPPGAAMAGVLERSVPAAYIPQHPRFTEPTVAAELELAAGRPLEPGPAARLLERVRLEGYGERAPQTMSPGELRRLAVARALARIEWARTDAEKGTASLVGRGSGESDTAEGSRPGRPSGADAWLLVADEPTAHLDAESARAVRAALAGLAAPPAGSTAGPTGRTVVSPGRRPRVALLVATHDRTLAAQLRDRRAGADDPGSAAAPRVEPTGTPDAEPTGVPAVEYVSAAADDPEASFVVTLSGTRDMPRQHGPVREVSHQHRLMREMSIQHEPVREVPLQHEADPVPGAQLASRGGDRARMTPGGRDGARPTPREAAATGAARRRPRPWRTVLRGLPWLGRWGMATGLLYAAAAVAFGAALSGVSGWLIVNASYQPPMLHLMVAVVGVRFFGIGRALLHYLEQLAVHDALLGWAGRLRERLWEALAADPRWWGPITRGGGALALLVQRVDDVRDSLPRVVVPPVAAVVTWLLACGAFALWVPSALGVALALGIVGFVVLPLAVVASERSTGSRIAAHQAWLGDRVPRLLRAADDLAGNATRERAIADFAELDRRQTLRLRASARTGGLAVGGAALISSTAAVLALVLPALGGAPSTGEQAAIAALLLLALGEPIAQAASSAQRARQLGDGLDRLGDVLAGSSARSEAPVRSVGPCTGTGSESEADAERLGGLRLRGATLGWEPGTAVVEDLDLQATPGRWAVLQGPSGSGKSTVLAALLGALPLWSGQLEVSEPDAGWRAATPEDLDRVAWCPQEAHLFDSTVRRNLGLGRDLRDQPTAAELTEVLDRVGLGEWLSAQPAGLDATIGSGGHRLSGGQRQRLAVARALLARADVVLLDEPTAHLGQDEASELIRDLETALADRAVVLVTHVAGVLTAATRAPLRVG
ncbi:thiol reductant ABC exporter subunit CydC [Zhihengliuella sp.]|uniref:thiol reductant ABC exporter subunit CydC n=1 Tax=Zhihengliuella sp. TaxID=1954483 RepID=UPI002812857D|nr:thiol reductant ABC exporter subunit CydC [Zhihengliuella sp.]